VARTPQLSQTDDGKIAAACLRSREANASMRIMAHWMAYDSIHSHGSNTLQSCLQEKHQSCLQINANVVAFGNQRCRSFSELVAACPQFVATQIQPHGGGQLFWS